MRRKQAISMKATLDAVSSRTVTSILRAGERRLICEINWSICKLSNSDHWCHVFPRSPRRLEPQTTVFIKSAYAAQNCGQFLSNNNAERCAR